MTDNTDPRSVPTEHTQTRNFGVLDLMVSIAGMALFLAYGRHKAAGLFGQIMGACRMAAAYLGVIKYPPQFIVKHMAMYGSGVLWYGIQLSQHIVLIMTPVFLLMRLTPPRPTVRALLKQPGTIAALAVAFGLIWVTGWLHRLHFVQYTTGTLSTIAVGGTVAFAWACLALSRKWEAERSWIDRLGRFLGATAITVGLIALLKYGI